MQKYVIKLNDLYYCHGIFSQRITFAPKFEEAKFFDTMDEAISTMTEGKLPENCKIKQVTYVEHDIGYVEHEPLSK